MIKVKKNPTTKLMIVGLRLHRLVSKRIYLEVIETKAGRLSCGVSIMRDYTGIVLWVTITICLEVYINRVVITIKISISEAIRTFICVVS